METLWNGVCMEDSLFRLGTDSVACAWFAKFPKSAKVCDLGCGSGAIALMLLASDPSLTLTGIELMPRAAQTAKENAARNGLPFTVIEGDLRKIRDLLPAGSMDGVISNPPYFPVGSGAAAKGELAQARSEETCTLSQLTAAMGWLLKTGGRAVVVHRPERLAELIFHLKQEQLEPKRIRFVRHRLESPVSLVLLEARKGGRPGLQYEHDLILFDDQGETEEYKRMYHRHTKE
ncbi:MAG: methyltransferase [Oscillospiraceae bacterium]|nr:methyltransferase [Oscillospiraceae bacterium]